jgi:shikimate dehydrogenase
MTDPAITGNTRLIGLAGWPVGHSLSPVMHNAAFRALALDYAYVPLPVAPDRAGSLVTALRTLGFAGANVTVPHKERAAEQVDALTSAAQAAGAVNTLTFRADGSTLGDSTDGAGFLADLRDLEIGIPSQALVLGAGGSARSVAAALIGAGVAVTVAARRPARAASLARALMALGPGRIASLPEWPPDCEAAARVGLVVNATSAGLLPGDAMPWDPGIPFRQEQAVYDLVYTQETALLEHARRHGAHRASGIGMLVYQGALAFERWTSVPAPMDVLWKAVGDRAGLPPSGMLRVALRKDSS